MLARQIPSGTNSTCAGGLISPAITLAVAASIIAFIMLFIVPKFDAMFREMELGELPVLTQALLCVSRSFVQYWYIVFIMPILVIPLLQRAAESPNGKQALDWLRSHKKLILLVIIVGMAVLTGLIVIALYLPHEVYPSHILGN